MDIIYSFLREYTTDIILVLVPAVLLLAILITINMIIISRINHKYKRMMRGSSGKNLEYQLIKQLEHIDALDKDSKSLKDDFQNLEKHLNGCVQKIGVHRYNAFDNMGSDLSFSITVLDGKATGFIITGLYGRDQSTTFAKPIINGKSKYTLSQEEAKSLQMAINSRQYPS